jgi:hypothetical protein
MITKMMIDNHRSFAKVISLNLPLPSDYVCNFRDTFHVTTSQIINCCRCYTKDEGDYQQVIRVSQKRIGAFTDHTKKGNSIVEMNEALVILMLVRLDDLTKFDVPDPGHVLMLRTLCIIAARYR